MLLLKGPRAHVTGMSEKNGENQHRMQSLKNSSVEGFNGRVCIYIYLFVHTHTFLKVFVFQSWAAFLAICCILELKSLICDLCAICSILELKSPIYMRTWLLAFGFGFWLLLAFGCGFTWLLAFGVWRLAVGFAGLLTFGRWLCLAFGFWLLAVGFARPLAFVGFCFLSSGG